MHGHWVPCSCTAARVCLFMLQANQHLSCTAFVREIREWARSLSRLADSALEHADNTAALLNSRGESAVSAEAESEADAVVAGTTPATNEGCSGDAAVVRPASANRSTGQAGGEVGQEAGRRWSCRMRRPVSTICYTDPPASASFWCDIATAVAGRAWAAQAMVLSCDPACEAFSLDLLHLSTPSHCSQIEAYVAEPSRRLLPSHRNCHANGRGNLAAAPSHLLRSHSDPSVPLTIPHACDI